MLRDAPTTDPARARGRAGFRAGFRASPSGLRGSSSGLRGSPSGLRGSLPDGAGRPDRDRQPLFVGYVGTVFVAALATGVTTGLAADLRSGPAPFAFWMMAGLAVAVQAPPLKPARRRPDSPAHSSICFTFAILVIWGPLPAALVHAVAVIVSASLTRGTLRGIAGNAARDAAQCALAFAAAAGVLRLGSGPMAWSGAAAGVGLSLVGVAVVVGAAAAWFAVFVVLVGTGRWLRSGGVWSRIVARTLAGESGSTLALLLLAPVVVATARISVWLVPLVLLVVYAINRMTGLVADQRRLAGRDPLTGLANRAALARAATEHVAGHAARAADGALDRRVALLVLDLDRFKQVNEALGHRVGDRLLVEVARRLAAVARPEDVVARLGGDEFALVVPGLPSIAAARRYAAWVSTALDEPVLLDALPLDVSGSIGIAVYPEHGADFATLMQHADVAMYDAKYRSAAVAVYTPESDHNTPERLALLADLRRALETRDAGVQLYYQPQVEISTGEVVGLEALLRWRHPRRGQVDPGELIRAVEHSTVMRLLTHRVLDEAMAQLARWGEAAAGLRVAVNVSVRDLHNGEIADFLAERIAAHGIRPDQLQLEITEGALMADPRRVLTTMVRLRQLGVSVSLDDFGTGYSSMMHLRRLPLSEVKIDRSFVLGVTTDEDDAAIVRSMIELAGALGLRVVAEGVEDDRTWRMLAAAGCDVAQGWYCARPMPADDLMTWLERYRGQRPAGSGEADQLG